MDQFLGNCSTCTIDAIALHWYDSATNTGYINAYFDDAIARWGKPVSHTSVAVPVQPSIKTWLTLLSPP